MTRYLLRRLIAMPFLVLGIVTLAFLLTAVTSASPNVSLFSATSVNDNAWHHIAAVRDGTTLHLFVDGVQEDTDTFVGAAANNGSMVVIGAAHYSDGAAITGFYAGNVDDVRITKGTARYTANFTPPTAQFADA